MRVLRTLVLLIGLPCIILGGIAAVIVATVTATVQLIWKVWGSA